MALAQLATMLVKLISVLSVLQLSLALPADNQVLAAAQHGQDSEVRWILWLKLTIKSFACGVKAKKKKKKKKKTLMNMFMSIMF